MKNELTDSLRAFEVYNRGRLEKALQVVPQKSTLAVHLAPLLLHYNIRGLPGFLDCDGDCGGISFFKLTDEIKTAASRNLPNFRAVEMEMKDWQTGKPMIDSLLLMGSIGTAAQGDKSDYDYWVVIDQSDLGGQKMDLLNRKLRLLEQWAEKKGAEFHFFITDVNRVRKNDFGSASRESVGSSQAGLLKEEFYRTMLYVAGKYPAWWLSPPAASDEQYAATLKELSQSSSPSPGRFVDLGNLRRITIDEYFGAALWQVNKAMDYPFKSMLKMALLESFINAEGESLLLCEELKENILSRNATPGSQDPYLIMIDRLLNYYSGKKRDDIVDLIRECFYITVNVKIANVLRSGKKPTYKEDVMLHYTGEWEWNSVKIARLDNYSAWDFEQVQALGRRLHGFLIETYKTFTEQYGTRLISDKDLAILGRKFLAYYNPKREKIMYIKRAIDETIRQESCTFMPIIKPGKKTVWVAYRGNVTAEVARKLPLDHARLRKEKSLAELTAWLVINRMIDSGTFMHLIPNPLPISMKVIQQLVKHIEEILPYQSITSIDNKLLIEKAFVTSLLVVANLTADNWAKNVEEIAVVYRSSHGETFSETHDAKTGRERLIKVLSAMKQQPGHAYRRSFQIFIPRTNNSAKMEKQLMNVILSNIGQSRPART
jgi:adenylate cyclase class 1